MSDRIGVMNEGRLLQVGEPSDIYEHPTSRFVADFIGEINLLPACVVSENMVELGAGLRIAATTGEAPGTDVTVAIRPERLELYDLDEPVPDGANRIEGTVVRRTYYGDVFFYDVDTPAGRLEAKEENRPGIEHYEHGDRVLVVWHPSAMSAVGD